MDFFDLSQNDEKIFFIDVADIVKKSFFDDETFFDFDKRKIICNIKKPDLFPNDNLFQLRKTVDFDVVFVGI